MNDAESVRSLIAANAFFANDSSMGVETAVESWVQTFASDAVFVVDRYAIEKHERLRSFHRAVLTSGHAFAKHFIGGSVIDVEGKTASGRTDFLLIAPNATWSIVGAGHYEDVFRKRDGHWLIQHRAAIVSGGTPPHVLDIAREHSSRSQQ